MPHPVEPTWEIGDVVGFRGLRGELRVRMDRHDPLALQPGRLVLSGETEAEYSITAERWVGPQSMLLRLAGIDSRDAAQALVGARVGVRQAWFSQDPVPAVALVGASVVDDEDGRALGRVSDVLYNGAQHVLVIGEGADEKLVPHVEAFVPRVEHEGPEGTVIRLRAIPGLLEDG